MGAGHFYRVRIFGRYLGEDWMNVFYYKQVVGVPVYAANDMCNAFVQSVVPQWQAMTTTENYFVKIDAQSNFTFDDFAELLFESPTTGVRSRAVNTDAPSATAINLRSNRGGIGMRASQKRFCGFLDTDFSGNNFDGGILALANNLSIAMAATISWTLTPSDFSPCHVIDAISPPLYKDFQYLITAWSPNQVVSSQRSRRP